MKYTYKIQVKDNDKLRESFNKLTQKTFCFNFKDWYDAGHWGDLYIPHVLLDLDGENVISNVSVNIMEFDICGEHKKYLQIGTVMTDNQYRNQGLNAWIMNQILKEYEGQVDGIYLFGNDSVLNYYPKFGFQPSKEYEYYMSYEDKSDIFPYILEQVDITQNEQSERLYSFINQYSDDSNKQENKKQNQNDAMYMSKNLNLYQFWLAMDYGKQIYYLLETNTYVIAHVENETLYVHQIYGREQVDIQRLAKSFTQPIKEIILEYTPVHKDQYQVREFKEEDCTLFIIGEDLKRIEQDKMRFAILSHA